MRTIRRQLAVSLVAIVLSAEAAAVTGPGPGGESAAWPAEALPPAHAVQRDGMSLSEAVESVRRRNDVERIISAETRVSNGREVHHIRAMTRDGKVKTYRINGQQRD